MIWVRSSPRATLRCATASRRSSPASAQVVRDRPPAPLRAQQSSRCPGQPRRPRRSGRGRIDPTPAVKERVAVVVGLDVPERCPRGSRGCAPHRARPRSQRRSARRSAGAQAPALLARSHVLSALLILRRTKRRAPVNGDLACSVTWLSTTRTSPPCQTWSLITHRLSALRMQAYTDSSLHPGGSVLRWLLSVLSRKTDTGTGPPVNLRVSTS
jgi:hypothetical protein